MGAQKGDAHEGDLSDDSEQIDPYEDERQENLAKQRKKAGLPELDVNSVPSTIAPKMLNLYLYISHKIP